MSRVHIRTAVAFSVATVVLAVVLVFLRSKEEAAMEEALPPPSEDAVGGEMPQPGDAEKVTAPLESRRAVICGIVMTAGGSQVAAALVGLRGSTGWLTSRTGESGEFCFRGLAPGSYDLAAASELGRSETVEGLVVGAGDELLDLALVLRRGTSVMGRVLDRLTGEGIGNARVRALCSARLGLCESESSTDGGFTLSGVPKGRHVLLVTAPGFSSGEMLLDVPGQRPVRGVNVLLDPLARVSGRVEDAAGAPVKNAKVRAVGYRLRSRPMPQTVHGEGAVRSLEDGSFELEAEPGLVTILADAAGHGPGRTPGVESRAGGAVEGVVVRLSTGSGLVVDVLDVDGLPAGGAFVRALCEGEIRCGSAVADQHGRAALRDLSTGIVRVEAAAPGNGGRASLDVHLEAGIQRRLTVALSDTGVITGLVLDHAERPVEGAFVRVLDEMGNVIGNTGAGPEGRFRISVPEGDHLTVEAEAGGLTGERRSVRAGDDVRLVLAAEGEITGYVTDQAGRPVADFSVTLLSSGDADRGVSQRQRFLSERGDFAFEGLSPGAYRLQAAAPGYAPGEEVSVRVWPGEARGSVKLTVSSAGRVFGRVTALDGELPIEGARVALEPRRLRGPARWVAASGATVKSDAKGEFLLDGVPAGYSTRVFAWHPDWSAGASAPVMVEEDVNSGPVTIRLRARESSAKAVDAFGGVGMTIGQDDDGHIRVGKVYPGGPAFLAGLRERDRILFVDGAPADHLGLRGALKAIRGPVGTDVNLVLEREGDSTFEARMVRVELRM